MHVFLIVIMAVPEQGVGHPWPVPALKGVLDSTGYRRVLLNLGGEPSIRALAAAVKETWKGERVPEVAPKGARHANGEVEHSIKTAHGLARTCKESLEQHLGKDLRPDHPVLAWITLHAGTLYNLFHGEARNGSLPRFVQPGSATGI